MRRFFLFVVLVVLTVAGIRYWSENRQGTRRPERYTPAEGPLLDTKSVEILAAMDREFTQLVEKVVPSVVSITTAKRVRSPQVVDPFEMLFGRRMRVPSERVVNSLGSGVIVSKEGHILTNNHVIAEVDQIQVQLSDGRQLPARVIGADPATDLAVLKVDEGKDLVPLAFADSDAVKVGQRVLAIGNPFGLDETVTQGIISAKGRRAMQDSEVEFFQTDAPINPGNSGGPLVSLRGEIVGINTAIGDYAGTQTWQGVGFVIPANTARLVMESLLKAGRVTRGYIGIVMQEVTPELARQFGAPDGKGVLVAEVAPDSPAARAGLKTGDIIRKIDSHLISGMEELARRVSLSAPGSEVQLTLWRKGEEQTLKATIGEQPADMVSAFRNRNGSMTTPQGPAPQQAIENVLTGIRVVEIPRAHREEFPAGITGVMVAEISNESPADGSLQLGDVIEAVNNTKITSVEQFQEVASRLGERERAVLYLSRGRMRSFVVLTPR